METTATINDTRKGHVSRIRHAHKPIDRQQIVEKTPESELMTVEEYFDEVWQRYLEKYENLQA